MSLRVLGTSKMLSKYLPSAYSDHSPSHFFNQLQLKAFNLSCFFALPESHWRDEASLVLFPGQELIGYKLI